VQLGGGKIPPIYQALRVVIEGKHDQIPEQAFYMKAELMRYKPGTGDETMKKREFSQFQQLLERQRDEILRCLARSNKEGRVLEEDCPQDLGDRSITNFSRELLFQQSTLRHQLLRKIEVALERIREGTFGECTSCGEQISVRRLEAMPFAVYCRDCQESVERERVTEDGNAPQRSWA
jgi:DnaK suppressor protein